MPRDFHDRHCEKHFTLTALYTDCISYIIKHITVSCILVSRYSNVSADVASSATVLLFCSLLLFAYPIKTGHCFSMTPLSVSSRSPWKFRYHHWICLRSYLNYRTPVWVKQNRTICYSCQCEGVRAFYDGFYVGRTFGSCSMSFITGSIGIVWLLHSTLDNAYLMGFV